MDSTTNSCYRDNDDPEVIAVSITFDTLEEAIESMLEEDAEKFTSPGALIGDCTCTSRYSMIYLIP
jgi:hypothetical protein